MGFYKQAEQELLLNIAAAEPHQVSVYTSWPFYVTRFDRSEGFEATTDFQPEEGGRCLEGWLDISEFNFLHLRKQFGSEQALARFNEERQALPPSPLVDESDFRIGVGERETIFKTDATDPYWITVSTDAAVWLRRLDQHPFAVCVAELRYAADAGGEQLMRTYKLPRQLLTIRRNKPRYSEEYREQLRQRLSGMRAS